MFEFNTNIQFDEGKQMNSTLCAEMIHHISDPAIILSQNRFVLHANKSFEKTFGSICMADQKNQCEALRGLKLVRAATTRSKGKHLPQNVLFLDNKMYTAWVFPLSDPVGGEKRFLVILNDEAPGQRNAGLLQPADLSSSGHIVPAETLHPAFDILIGEDIHFKEALLTAQRAAKSELPVLIIGASGTGKELLARAIHNTSRRAAKNLIDVNCSAIPETLIESELFGYERGAFTGARSEGRIGYFDEADGGTLLMDEIGDASLQVQAKLLRVLEGGRFKRVGGIKNVRVDVRIISSTNRDLWALINENKFREDLYYRLNTLTIRLPSLKDRKKDIPLLVDHFLNCHREADRRQIEFLPETMNILENYHWPGNVRELKSVVDYAVTMTYRSVISPDSLPQAFFAKGSSPTMMGRPMDGSFETVQNLNMNDAEEAMQKEMLKQVLGVCKNKTEAIKTLGISRSNFYIKLKKYGIKTAKEA